MRLDFGKPTELSYWAYSILLAQLMATLVHCTYTVPLVCRPCKFMTETWDPWRALHGRHGSEIHPSDRETSVSTVQACLGLWLALLGPIASPNGPNGRFNPPPPSHPPPPPAPHPSHSPTLYNVPSVILQSF